MFKALTEVYRNRRRACKRKGRMVASGPSRFLLLKAIALGVIAGKVRSFFPIFGPFSDRDMKNHGNHFRFRVASACRRVFQHGPPPPEQVPP